MVHSLWLSTKYIAHFDSSSSSWQCLVDRACLWGYQVDTARGGAGRLVEHASRLSFYIQLDSGRSLAHEIRDYSRPPTLLLSIVRTWRQYSLRM